MLLHCSCVAEDGNLLSKVPKDILITVFTAALLMLAFKTRFVIVGFNSESGWRRILQPKEQKTPILSRGYVLSYRFWDQTSGVVKVMSLQCWAEMMNMTVYPNIS